MVRVSGANLTVQRWTLDFSMSEAITMNVCTPRRRHTITRVYGKTLWACVYGLLAMFALCSEEAKAVDSGNEARTWLKKIISSSETVSYEGIFVYRRDDQLVSMHLIHVADKDGERDRLTSLSGEQQELIKSKAGIICLTPGKKHITLNRGSLGVNFPDQLASRMQDVEKNYRLIIGGTDRIAGRTARMIVIEPKDSFRYGYRMWVDEETGLLLQSDLVNGHGNAIEQVMFSTINIVDKATPQMIQAVTMNDEMRRVLKSSKPETVSAADAQWQVMHMPNGFSLVERYQHSHGKWGPVEQLVLTDGMATVSVFVERLNKLAEPFNGESHKGAVNAYGTVVGDHQLTVVGEVPLATVRLIGNSLRLTVAGQ
jgi:sigma-E factor negative regulatory protein RseB